MTTKTPVHVRVARNFIRNRGRAKFALLIDMLERQASGQEIATLLGVSRERVRQWRDTFGETITMYRLHPDVVAVYRSRPTGHTHDATEVGAG